VMTAKAFFSPQGAAIWRTLLAIPALLICISTMSATSARAEAPATYMQRVQNELIAAQRAGSVSAYSSVLRRHMAVAPIGLTALGPHAKTLSKAERPAFYNGMISFISKYAAKEGSKYPIASAVVTGQSAETAGGATVDTHITLRSGEGYDVRWKLVRSGQSYKVRDAQVIGFWMTSFLDNLFQTWITENGNNPHALVVALNN
jgi:phospholipid transport system substrate-binding protein